MANLTTNIAALEQLPETDSTALGILDGDGCGLVTCVVSCVITIDASQDH